MKKMLVINKKWQKTSFEVNGNNLIIESIMYEPDEKGDRCESASSCFSVPFKKVKNWLLKV